MLLLRKPVLSRRELLAIASVSCGGSPGWGADQDNGSLMMDFMRELDAADTLRRRNLDTVRKPGATERALHQKVLRVMIGGIGAFPKRTPRNSVHVGNYQRACIGLARKRFVALIFDPRVRASAPVPPTRREAICRDFRAHADR